MTSPCRTSSAAGACATPAGSALRGCLGGWLSGALVLACTSGPVSFRATPPAEPPPPPPAPPALQGEVLVRDNAWLYAAPDSAVRFRYKATGSVAPREVHRFTVLADQGPWLQLMAGPADDWPSRACSATLYQLRALGLSLWARRQALAPATTRTVATRFSDGTSVTVFPGVPVGPARTTDGWHLIDTEPARLFAPLPSDALGLAFQQWSPPRKGRQQPLGRRLTRYAILRYGQGEHIATEGDPNTMLQQIRIEGEYAFVSLETACFQATARISQHSIEEDDKSPGDSAVGLLGALSDGKWREISAGMTVYWPDGQPAGKLTRAWVVRADELQLIGALQCDEQVLGEHGPAAERTLRVCFRAADIQPAGDLTETLFRSPDSLPAPVDLPGPAKPEPKPKPAGSP